MTTPRMQLIPFHFMIDFIENTSFNVSNVHTYFLAIKETYFYVPLFNIILTVPFGMFLRYFYKCDKKDAVIYTFLLSLFFELTQLTGLYFLYPRGYRLFDVDDLILNTLGGVIGFILCKPFMKIFPKIDEVNLMAKEKGKVISGLRRTLSFLLDLFIVIHIYIFIIVIFQYHKYLFLSIIVIYYFIIPLFLDTSTLGEKFLNIQILDYDYKKNFWRLLYRKFLAILIYIFIPFATISVLFYITDDYVREFGGLILIVFFILVYSITSIKYLFTSKDMIYEKISKTKLVSTIK